MDFDGDWITLAYSHNGRRNEIRGKIDSHFENSHFDLVVKSANVNELLTDANQNELYFTFNSVQSFASRYLPNLQVVPIDPIAKTIQVTFRGNNPQLCHDLTLAIAEAFVNYDEENKRKGSENILNFILRFVVALKTMVDTLMYDKLRVVYLMVPLLFGIFWVIICYFASAKKGEYGAPPGMMYMQ